MPEKDKPGNRSAENSTWIIDIYFPGWVTIFLSYEG